MNTLLSHPVAALFDLLVKGTFLLLGAVLVCRLLRRSSSAIRQVVWVTALGSVLLLPLLSLSLPRWQVVLRIAAATPASVTPASAQDSLTALRRTSGPVAPDLVTRVPAPEGYWKTVSVPAVSKSLDPMRMQKHPLLAPIHLAVLGAAVWWVGFLLVVAPFAVGLRRIGCVRRAAVPLDGSALGIAEAARQQLGIGRDVAFLRALEGSAVAVPVTWGVLRPVVLLSAQSSDWSEDCLRAVLLHELAHIARWDWPMQLLGRLACAFYWWHPLVWKAARQARAESESACDDLVLMTGMRAPDYAQRLVEVVCSMPEGAHARTVAMAMVQPLEVEARIEAVLATGRNRSHLTRRKLAITLVTVALLLLPFSAFRPIARASAQNRYSASLIMRPSSRIRPQTVRQNQGGNNAAPSESYNAAPGDSNKDLLRHYHGTRFKLLSETPLKRMKRGRHSPAAKNTAFKTVKTLFEPPQASVSEFTGGLNDENGRTPGDRYNTNPGGSNNNGDGGNPGDSNNGASLNLNQVGGNPGDSNNDGHGGNPGDSNNDTSPKRRMPIP